LYVECVEKIKSLERYLLEKGKIFNLENCGDGANVQKTDRIGSGPFTTDRDCVGSKRQMAEETYAAIEKRHRPPREVSFESERGKFLSLFTLKKESHRISDLNDYFYRSISPGATNSIHLGLKF
jgi:hypothetical protein